MIFKNKILELKTSSPIELVDVTDLVANCCREERIKNGLVVVNSQHTTAAVSINEKCGRLHEDFFRGIGRAAPVEAGECNGNWCVTGNFA